MSRKKADLKRDVETKYFDQGRGRGIVYETLAKIDLKNRKKNPTKDNINRVMQDLAHESMESFIPNPLLGSNPSPRISQKIKKMIEMDERAIIDSLPEYSITDAKKGREELSRAVSHLTSAIMEHIFGLSPEKFAYLSFDGPTGPRSVENIEMENALRARRRIFRVIVFTFLWTTVKILARTGRKGLLDIFRWGGSSRIEPKNFMKGKTQEQIINAVVMNFNSPGKSINLMGDLKPLFTKAWIIARMPKADLKDLPLEKEEKQEQLSLDEKIFDDPRPVYKSKKSDDDIL